jgi:hypothetical protein
MVWVKIDDGFPDNPKVDRLSDGAFRLYVSALCDCQRHLTDGRVDTKRIQRLVPKFKKAYITELVEAGLWEVNGQGFVVHDFELYNRTREYWENERKKGAERLARWRAKQEES